MWSNLPTASAEHRALLFADIVAPRALGKLLDDPVALWAEIDRALHVLRVQSGDAGALSAAAAASTLRSTICAPASAACRCGGRQAAATRPPGPVLARASIPPPPPPRRAHRALAR